MCTGACLRAAAQSWVQLGLGWVLVNLLLDLLRVLLLLRDHFIHDSFGGDGYTYAHDMRMYAITICNNNL